MQRQCRREKRPWGRVVSRGVVLLLAHLLPSPFRRHPAFGRVGPDKALHLVGFAWFASALADAHATGPATEDEAALCSIVLSTGYAALTGELQRLVPGRVPEPADLVAGFLGATAGALVWRYRRGARSAPSTT